MKKIGIFLAFCTLAVGSSLTLAQTTDSYGRSVTRAVLASGYPSEAKGKILELVSYTIPPLVKLPTHIHPGMQIEKVESGILTYTVVQGTAIAKRAKGVEESISDGQTIDLYPGDSLTEPAGMIHYGENKTPNPVILLSASLFDIDRPKAILVTP
jgi:quercetin dioxygenase-like cupin family protein